MSTFHSVCFITETPQRRLPKWAPTSLPQWLLLFLKEMDSISTTSGCVAPLILDELQAWTNRMEESR